VEEVVKTLGKGVRSCRRPDRVTQRHLLEGKKQVRSGFDRDRVRRDFAMLALSQQLAEKRFAQRLIPPLVSFPFIAALLQSMTLGNRNMQCVSDIRLAFPPWNLHSF